MRKIAQIFVAFSENSILVWTLVGMYIVDLKYDVLT